MKERSLKNFLGLRWPTRIASQTPAASYACVFSTRKFSRIRLSISLLENV